MPTASNGWRTGRLLFIALFVTVVGAALVVDPGPFSIDEVIYQLMTASLRDGHGVAVWNGYEEHPSPELSMMWVKEFQGKLYGQYPFLYIILAAPFQAALGFRGLFVLNALAYVLSAWLCFRLGYALFRSTSTAYLGAGLFSLGSFSLDYAVAAWPHAVAACLVLGASVLIVGAWQAERRRLAIGCALGAGACLGLGLGVRIDVALVAPILLAPFVFPKPMRWRELLAVAGGALGPLLAEAAFNWQRWQQFAPATQGRSVTTHLPILVGLAVVASGAWLMFRLRHSPWLVRHRRWTLLGLALLVIAALCVPTIRSGALKLVRGLGALVIDLRQLPLDRVEPAMSRTAAGAVVYLGTLKKALLQSCPYLGILVAGVVLARQAPKSRPALAFLLAVPACTILFYARAAWHGGMAFNLRYFTLILPFLAVLCAYVVRQIVEADVRFQSRLAGLGVVLTSAGLLALRPWQQSAGSAQTLLLDGSLLLALSIVFAALLWSARPTLWRARACTALASVGVAWAAVVGLGYDTVRSQMVRSMNYQLGTLVADHIADDSLLFVQYPDPFASVLDHRDNVRIAVPANDQFRDMTRLADFHLAQGRPVFAIFTGAVWAQLAAAPALQRYEVNELARLHIYSLRRIMGQSPALTSRR